jgi:hypothetical protein
MIAGRVSSSSRANSLIAFLIALGVIEPERSEGGFAISRSEVRVPDRASRRSGSDRRTRRPGTLFSAGAIASYVGVAPRLRQSGKKALLLQQSNNSVRERSLAQGALDGGSQRRPLQ